MSDYHEFTDAFAEVSYPKHFAPREIISRPSPNDNYCLWIYPFQEISMKNPGQIEWDPTSLCDKPRHYSQKESVLDHSDLVLI